jgi:hypothetical protein
MVIDRLPNLGREDVLKDVAGYLRGDGSRPLVPHGVPGCGKSSIMAQAREVAQSRAASQTMGQMMQSYLQPSILTAVQQLKPLAAEAGCSMTQFALAWVLREPDVASAIVGASRPAQLDDNAVASGLVVDPALFAKAEAIIASIRIAPWRAGCHFAACAGRSSASRTRIS